SGHPRYELINIAYTLQVGREAFPFRLAIIADSVTRLTERLASYVDKGADGKNIFFGVVNEDGSKAREMATQASINDDSKKHISSQDLAESAMIWVNGGELDWATFYDSPPPHKVSLPTYPFARDRYWGVIAARNEYPLIDRIVADKSLGSSLVFNKSLDTSDPLVRDHVINGDPMLPGVGYLEMALEVGKQIIGKAPHVLTQIFWTKPLRMGGKSRTPSIEVGRRDDGSMHFEVTSVEGAAYRKHCVGKIKETGASRPRRVSIEDIKSRCTQEFSGDEIYERFSQAGVAYGPLFRGIVRVWRGEGETLSLLSTDHLAADDLHGAFVLHPTIADGALQSIIALRGMSTQENAVFVPYSIETVEVFRPCGSPSYSHVKALNNERIEVSIMDAGGIICVLMRDVILRTIAQTVETCLCRPDWIEIDRKAPSNPIGDDVPRNAPRRMMVIAPEKNPRFGEILHAFAVDRNCQAILLGTRSERLSANQRSIDVRDRHALDRIIGEAAENGSFPYDTILFFADSPYAVFSDYTEALRQTKEIGILSLFRLLKALLKVTNNASSIRVCIFTNRAHSFNQSTIADPHSASLYGLATSVSKEFNKIRCTCFDTDLDSSESFSKAGYPESILDLIEDEAVIDGAGVVSLRNGKAYSRRYLPLKLPRIVNSGLKQRGVYLIVGGMSGIGLVLSRYLAANYQACLVLVGRSPLKAEKKNLIRELEQIGGSAMYTQADVSDLAEMKEAVERGKSRFGVIQGAVHSAIVLDDCSFKQMDENSLAEVLAPKVDGCIHFQKALSDEHLDFMLFFSSTQFISPNPGQANYAAASTFEDAYSAFLNQEKPYPVKLINWGYWGSVGIVARPEMQEKMARIGIHSIEPHEGLQAIETALSSPIDQLIMIKANCDALERTGVDFKANFWVREQTFHSILTEMLRNPPFPKVPEDIENLTFGVSRFTEFCRYSLLDVFIRMGAFREGGEVHDIREFASKLAVHPGHRRLLDALLDILCDWGIIEFSQKQLVTTELAASDRVKEGLKNLRSERQEILASYPRLSGQIKLLCRCIDHYPQILTGEIAATDVVFPDGSTSLVEGVYRDNVIVDALNDFIADCVVSFIVRKLKQDPTSRVNILELGAGTGGTSSKVLPAIREYADSLHYCYTDLSPAFIEHGKREYGRDYSFMNFALLDIEKDMAKQLSAGNSGTEEFDIVIASNVVHAVKNVRDTLLNIKGILRANGWLLLNEMTELNPFLTLTFGLLEGWWLFEDEERRVKHSPLLKSETWESLLTEIGFKQVAAHLGRIAPGIEELSQHAIIAESDGCSIKNFYDETTMFIDIQKKDAAPAHERNRSSTPSPVDPRPAPAFPDDTLVFIKNGTSAIVCECLGKEPNEVKPDKQFSDLGVDSIIAVDLIAKINEYFSIVLKTTVIYDYPNIESLSAHIHGEHNPVVPTLDCEAADHSPATAPFIGANVAEHTCSYNCEPEDSHCGTQPRGSRVEAFHPKKFPAVVLCKPGDISDIAVSHVACSSPEKDEIQVAVKAFSLNFGDLLCVRGLYPTMPPYPFTPGFEIAGRVVQVGPDVKHLKVGDAVFGVTGERLGGQGVYVNTRECFVTQKPTWLSYEDACSLPVVFLTVYHVFKKAVVEAGERVLIQTGAGGIGLMAIQLAQWKGAEVYTTVGSREKAEYVHQLGVKNVILYREEDFFEVIMRETDGRGVDLVINTLSGENIQKGLDVVAPEGRYAEIAMTGLKSGAPVSLSNLVHNQTFFSIDLRRILAAKAGTAHEYLGKLLELMEAGIVKPTVGKVFKFDEVQDGYRYMNDRKNIGKIVVNQLPITETVNTAPSKVPARAERPNTGQSISASQPTFDIAIIGMSGRFPGAENIDEFWTNLQEGCNAITVVPENRWDPDRYYDPDPTVPNKTTSKWGGFLRDIDRFDAEFFGISGREAFFSDPQQRIFLEESWKALEDAGYAIPAMSNKKCGVFVGVSAGDYQTRMFGRPLDDAHFFWGNASSILAARISYFLNLKGPSIAVDTACSSSLTALHYACRSLLAGECETALCGGVHLITSPNFHILAGKAGMLSPDGKCSVFDKSANGFVPGEAVGAVVLKPLSTAQRDRDYIYGVIKGTAINQDGKTNGITAPSALSQTEVEAEVYKSFNISPDSISYVEAHGTATNLGDPIELQALTNAFRSFTKRRGYCAIGSVKSNVGHGATAAGITGLIKILLAMKNKTLPPSLNYRTPNPLIDFETSPFYVNTECRPWETDSNTPRRAALSSFGFSGTNVHVVVEESCQTNIKHPKHARPSWLIPISAKTETALRRKLRSLVEWLERDGTRYTLADIAYTLAVGRTHFPLRIALIIQSKSELAETLGSALDDESIWKELFVNIEESSATTKTNGAHTAIGRKREVYDTGVKPIDKDHRHQLQSVYEHYRSGADPEWSCLFNDLDCRRIPLPTYPFEGDRYWIESPNYGETSEKGLRKIDKSVPINTRNSMPVAAIVASIVSEVLGTPEAKIEPGKNLHEYGLDSILSMKLLNRLNNRFALDLGSETLNEFPTIAELVHIVSKKASEGMSTDTRKTAIDSGNKGPRESIETLRIDCSGRENANQNGREEGVSLLVKLLRNGMGVYRQNGSLVVEYGQGSLSDTIREQAIKHGVTLYPVLDPEKKYFAMSDSQKAYCIETELYKNPAYQTVSPVWIEEAIDYSLYENALHLVMLRHDILRTTFPNFGKARAQVINAEPMLQTAYQDISTFDCKTQDARIAETLRQEKVTMFDLKAGPLLRFTFIKLREARHLHIIAIHHTIADGASMHLLLSEITATYRAMKNGDRVDLPPPAVQYRHYVASQATLKPTVLHDESRFWRERLLSHSFHTEIPTDYPRPQRLNYRCGVTMVPFTNDERDSLQAFCRKMNISLTTLSLAGLAVTLHNWSGKKIISIGTASNQRHRLEYEKCIGDFNDLIPFQVKFEANEKLGNRLYRVSESFKEAYSHRSVSFAQLVKLIGIERNPSGMFYNVVFDSLLNIDSFSKSEGQSEFAYTMKPLSAHNFINLTYSLSDLFLLLMGDRERTAIVCAYQRTLFKQETITSVLQSFKQALHSFIEDDRSSTSRKSTDITDMGRISVTTSHNESSNRSGNTEETRARFGSNGSGARPKERNAGHKPVIPLCIPGIDGDPSIFRMIKTHLGERQRLAGMTLDGVGKSKDAMPTIEEMGAYAIEALHSIQPSGPYHIVGFSFGGNVALEICHQLRTVNEERINLFLIDPLYFDGHRKPEHRDQFQSVTQSLQKDGYIDQVFLTSAINMLAERAGFEKLSSKHKYSPFARIPMEVQLREILEKRLRKKATAAMIRNLLKTQRELKRNSWSIMNY
ncbi:MAG: SDR family NAD(P)-dependent oxidoreductase, partial [Chitinivibrionales bacterium]|nr:SDR family NAD(P)-dependent oxidoreductase [Chitinivibrionales bacterium]MBD3356206.1 SDR family NAD(P)-dependent oxidoreductase [Chitinivibrionales bacterium]